MCLFSGSKSFGGLLAFLELGLTLRGGLPFLLRLLGDLLLRAAQIAVFEYHASEHVVRQFDALCSVAILEPYQPRANQFVEFLLGEMGRHRVRADVVVAEPTLGDEFFLDEDRNLRPQIAHTRFVEVRQASRSACSRSLSSNRSCPLRLRSSLSPRQNKLRSAGSTSTLLRLLS